MTSPVSHAAPVSRAAPAELTPAALDAAVVQLRQSNATQEALLWPMLLEKLHVDTTVLRAALSKWHGIAVLDDVQWAQIRTGNPLTGPVGREWTHISIRLESEFILLCKDPWDPQSISALLQAGTASAQLALATPEQWSELCRGGSGVADTGSLGVSSLLSLAEGGLHDVVQFVDEAIAIAWRDGASDIHFETTRSGIGIKYRLDGVMTPGARLPDPQKAEEVVSRIKVMGHLDITERRKPQDGRIHWSRPGHATLDLRVSVMPSIFGEDVVLRLLDKAQLRDDGQEVNLDVLGFEAGVASVIRDLAERPHGMLLVTGPTGSGKTTTVYAALCEVNDGLEKIVTIEDPVEYELAGVLQIPVNEQKGLTFATGLRSILRHDPDKILVGEIRDSETAEIAVQSSLTGHLVFTTVHANSLFDVLGRFHHFGIEPFALASALNGVVVQRLLRKLCAHCRGMRPLRPEEVQKLTALQLPLADQLPVACGCARCRFTGYKGRFVTAEVHTLTEAVRDLIVRRASMAELRQAMYPDVSRRLLAMAWDQVLMGHTTLEEVIRVVGLV